MRPDEIRIIDRDAVTRHLSELDPVAVVESTVLGHVQGHFDLPAEGYMTWTNGAGAYTRSIAMLGAVRQRDEWTYGIKLINASVSNPQVGMERAGGFTVLFDPETARPSTLVEAGYVSALRTAAYTMSTLRTIGPSEFTGVSLLGCGTVARMHVKLLSRYFPSVDEIHVHDIRADRASAFSAEITADLPELRVIVHDGPQECLAATDVLVTTTVSARPYVQPGWLSPDGFVAHVSLDDITADVFLDAAAIYVDDLDLVRDNPRRILGDMMRSGQVMSPDHASAPPTGPGRALTGIYGEVLDGRREAIRPGRGVVVSNPFGMSILDIAMCHAIAQRAEEAGLGTCVDLLGPRTRAALTEH